MYGSKRVLVRDLNPHILCALCGGYLIQATTVIECLHSFCRTCIVKFLETSKVCPICDAQIHKTRPLLNIRPDQTLQSLVYKLVPGLFQDEMRRRREFHATLSESDLEDLTLEERGEAKLEREYKQGDDHVSLILQMAYRKETRKPFKVKDTRYLLCPSEVTVRHLKRFLKAKFELGENLKIEMFRGGEELTDDLMLQDIALIYSWRAERPMRICYTITEDTKVTKSKRTLPKAISTPITHASTISNNSTQSVPRTEVMGKKSTVLVQTVLDVHAPDLSPPVLTPMVTCTSIAPPVTVLTPSAVTSSPPSVSTKGSAELVGQAPLKTAPEKATQSVSKKASVPSSPSRTQSKPASADLKNVVTVTSNQVSNHSETGIDHNNSGSDCFSHKDAVTEIKGKGSGQCEPRSKLTHLLHSVQSILSKSKKKSHQKLDIPLSWKPVQDVNQPTATPSSSWKPESLESLTPSYSKVTCNDQNNVIITDKPASLNSLGQSGRDRSQPLANETSKWTEPEKQESYIRVKDKAGRNLSESVDQTFALDKLHSTNQSDTAVHQINNPTSSFYLTSVDCPASIHTSSESDHLLKKQCNEERNYFNGSGVVPSLTLGNKSPTPPVKTSSDNTFSSDPADDDSIFSTYIPKFQRHRKFTSVKRSISCDHQSPSREAGAINSKSLTVSDSMEKRNWKKRKLSALDMTSPGNQSVTHNSFESNRQNIESDHLSPGDSITPKHDPYMFTSGETCTTSSVNSRGKLVANVHGLKSRISQTALDSSASPVVFPSPKNGLIPQNTKTECPASKNASDSPLQNSSKESSPKKRHCQDKVTNITTHTQNIATHAQSNNSLTNLVSRSPAKTTKLGKKCKEQKTASDKKNGNSRNSHSARSMAEITVDISSSPSDASSVTSPATDVTSPGTEDRTDTSVLTELTPSCDSDCVSNYQSRGTPLDLSSKRKK
ncbi:protein suppressor 2 of zeste-like [Biomphalaria glabrata]|uniref:Protein suppressor 2 of zeste-like n=1 Tax=Biomphalaria glabrata TaxID=6526 RepID=A0A9U8EBG7_BIOGL|nr:protein suppressor 2 of zeste-like [Biomphalaria glabrata]